MRRVMVDRESGLARGLEGNKVCGVAASKVKLRNGTPCGLPQSRSALPFTQLPPSAGAYAQSMRLPVTCMATEDTWYKKIRRAPEAYQHRPAAGLD
jgi:hypothetical protein